jgi:hypothetical protein
MEEVQAPKTEGTMEERLQLLEDTVFRYGTVIEHSLDAHQLMIIEMENKVELMRQGSKIWRTRVFISSRNWIGSKPSCEMWKTRTVSMKIASRRSSRLRPPSLMIHQHPSTMGCLILGRSRSRTPIMRNWAQRKNTPHQKT